jgi:hypothetical protein
VNVHIRSVSFFISGSLAGRGFVTCTRGR